VFKIFHFLDAGVKISYFKIKGFNIFVEFFNFNILGLDDIFKLDTFIAEIYHLVLLCAAQLLLLVCLELKILL